MIPTLRVSSSKLLRSNESKDRRNFSFTPCRDNGIYDIHFSDVQGLLISKSLYKFFQYCLFIEIDCGC